MSAISAETQTRIAQLRAKSQDGTLTLEDMREAVSMLRDNRLSAGQAAAKSIGAAKAKKPKAAARTEDSLLNELEGL